MSAPFNAYTTLGVTPSASVTDVKRAYLRLAATSHPDKGGSSEAFALVQKAYATLTDPRQKQSHDDALAKAGRSPAGGVAHVHGQTSGHTVSQHGVVAGVTVTLHGQTGPPPRQQQQAGDGAAVDAAGDTAGRALELVSQAEAGRTAAASGNHEQAVASFTRALRACAAGADTQGTGVTRQSLYAARSAAYAALGDHKRAQADAAEAAELAS